MAVFVHDAMGDFVYEIEIVHSFGIILLNCFLPQYGLVSPVYALWIGVGVHLILYPGSHYCLIVTNSDLSVEIRARL